MTSLPLGRFFVSCPLERAGNRAGGGPVACRYRSRPERTAGVQIVVRWSRHARADPRPSRASLLPRKQVRRRNAQRPCQLENRRELGIARAAFDMADLQPVHPGGLGELLLRPPAIRSQLTQTLSERDALRRTADFSRAAACLLT